MCRELIAGGDARGLLAARKLLPQFRYIFGPWNSGPRLFSLGFDKSVWERQYLHQNFDSIQNWSPIVFESMETTFSSVPEIKKSPFWVVNIKEHFNWGNTGIPNFYFLEEIREIVARATEKGRYVLLNRFPAPKEEENIDAPRLNFQEFQGLEHVIDLSDIYGSAPTLAEANSFQISLLLNAERVFATQGGNAALSISCSRKVTVLLRGGSDYPALVSLAKRYGTDLDFVHSAFQARF